MDEPPKMFPEYSQDDLDQIFEDALEAAKRVHSKITSLAEDTGYAVNAISVSKPHLDGLFNEAITNPSVYPFVASAIDTLRGLSDQFVNLEYLSDDYANQVSAVVNLTGTFSGSTGTGVAIFSIDEPGPFSLPPNRESRDIYSDKLQKLNPTLSTSYDQVWQTYYGTISEPHRAALFMMRTLFDNFFAWIAPDDEVRDSEFWARKEGDKPNQIWRRERIAYALEKNIKDVNRRKLLEAQSNQITILYKAANEAHKRGSLDEEKASNTLMSMDSFLKDWIDALI